MPPCLEIRFEMAPVRPIGRDDENPLGLRVIRRHDMHGHPVTHVEKQRARERTIIRLVLNDLAAEECRMHLDAGDLAFDHTLKRMPLPFKASGMNGLSQRRAIQSHLRGQCPGSRCESQDGGEALREWVYEGGRSCITTHCRRDKKGVLLVQAGY